MKKLTMAALLLGGAILASPSAFAAGIANDLYMGFQNGTNASADYIINLGAASSVVGGPINLSGDFSLSDFNAVLGISPSVQAGVVGVYQTSLSAPPPDLYATQLRTGAGDPGLPGSLAPQLESKSIINLAASPVLGSLAGPAAGTGILDTGKTWQSAVEPGGGISFYTQSGVNPDSAISPSGILYEDLWTVSNGTLTGVSPWTYLGYFTLDLSGSNPSLTFSPVPEPTVVGLLGGAGLLLLSFRRRLAGKNA